MRSIERCRKRPAPTVDCDRLIRVMNHKISQPLTTLRCDLESLLSGQGVNNEQTVKACIAAVDSAARFLYSFQSLSQASTRPVSMQTFDLLPLLLEGVEAFAGRDAERLLTNKLVEKMFVYGARDRVRQAIWLVLSYIGPGEETDWSVEPVRYRGECRLRFRHLRLDLASLEAAIADPLEAIDSHSHWPRELLVATAERLMRSSGGFLEVEPGDSPGLLLRIPAATARAAALR